MNPQKLFDELFEELKSNPRYSNLCDAALQRIARWASIGGANPSRAMKRAKQKLYQIHGSYWSVKNTTTLRSMLSNLSETKNSDDVHAMCRKILALHRSTRERLPIMDTVYSVLFREIGTFDSILDLACGLHPFSIPWMQLSPCFKYFAVDMDRMLVSSLNEFFIYLGRPYTAACSDILCDIPDYEVDIVFLFKLIPCLEQQDKGSSVHLMKSLNARIGVVSFPLLSFGGYQKGMDKNYARFMDKLVNSLNIHTKKIHQANEVFYILYLKGAP